MEAVSVKLGSNMSDYIASMEKRLWWHKSGSWEVIEEIPTVSRQEMMDTGTSAVVVRNGEQYLSLGHVLGYVLV